MRRTRIIVVSTLLLALMTGCTPTPTDVAPTTVSETAAPQPTAPQRDEASTLWHLEGSDETLPDDDPDVIALQRTVALHSATVDDRAPDTVDAALEDEFAFYTPAFVASLDDAQYRQTASAMYRDNGLATRQLGVAWTTSTISADRTRASVGFESIFEFTAGSDAYLSERGLKTGERYAQPRELSLVRDGDAWLIDGIQKGPLSRSETLGG